jgi:predicted DsbA family dithiol-disulfide isomerase
MDNVVTITEVSALVCPWCYIGKAFILIKIWSDRGVVRRYYDV